MKKSLLAIALAVASMPMVFAQAAAPQNPPASGTTANSTATTTNAPKAKHHKTKATKKVKKNTNATGNQLVKSAK